MSVTSAGSTGNSGNGDGSTRSQVQTLTNNGTTVLNTRFAWNISADVGAGSTRDQSGSAHNNVDFTVNSPGSYSVAIATRQTGNCRRRSDIAGCDGAADRGSTSGSRTGPGSLSGTLSMGDPCGIGNGGGNTSQNFNNTANATISDTSNGANRNHDLNFTWSGSVRSNSCEASVRQGAETSVTGCSACEYPGDPSRTQSNDGHFVNITVTHFCGDGVVNGVGEQCDAAAPTAAAHRAVRPPVSSAAPASNAAPRPASAILPKPAPAAVAVARPTDSSRGTPAARQPASAISPKPVPATGANCPADAKSVAQCRASAGVCDVAESCDGVGDNCPR